MPLIDPLFVTEVWREEMPDEALREELAATCLSLAADDEAGQRWCAANGYPGYTSYASLDDLPWRFPAFKRLKKLLDRQVADYARALDFDLKGGKLTLDGLWVNVLPSGGSHSGHLHPHAVISGTYYVAVPDGAGALRFEDPRLGLLMAAPGRKTKTALPRRRFVYQVPQPGTVLLWESWLRHEVPVNQGEEDRVSISFNYRWDRA